MKKFKKKSEIIIFILLVVLFVGIGYAALGANLKINGVADITSATWNVHFVEDSIHLTEGSVAITDNSEEAAASIDSSTEVSYHVKLTKPGDFYEFTVDVTNGGSIDAMIDSISSKIKIGDSEEVEIIPTGENRNLPSYLNYFVTYSDGVEIAPKHLLASNTTETFKVRLEFRTDIDESDLPITNQLLGLNFKTNYVQKDSTSIVKPRPKITGIRYSANVYDSSVEGNNGIYLGQEIPEGTILYESSSEALQANREQSGRNDINFYLKHVIENNIVTESYVEFQLTESMAENYNYITPGIYSLRVGGGVNCDGTTCDEYSPYYEDNKAVMRQAYGSAFPLITGDLRTAYEQTSSSSMYFYFDSLGVVEIYRYPGTGAYCCRYNNNNSFCKVSS